MCVSVTTSQHWKCVYGARFRPLCQVLRTPSTSLLNPGKTFCQLFSAPFFNFVFSLPMIHPPSPLLLFYMTVCACACVSVSTRLCTLIACVANFRSVFESSPFIPLSLSASVKIVAVCWVSNIRWFTFNSECFLLGELPHSHTDLARPAMQMKLHSLPHSANDGSWLKSVLMHKRCSLSLLLFKCTSTGK